ncbi:MAG: hypothetical protein ACI83E_002837 [Sulfitobacter sp.]|jgi:hypothetical protein
MSFKDNLIKARSHIIFLVALAFGLALVTWIDRGPDADASTQATGGQMAQFEDITPLPLAITGTSSDVDLEHARIAWRYFQNNSDPVTGLVNSTDNYPSTTMWETGSYFVATMSAQRLGVIERDEAVARISLSLDTLQDMRLFDGVLPNKAYNVRTGELVNYANEPVERGLGWSALDIARMVGALGHVEANYPELAPKTATLMARWRLSDMVEDGQLIGGNMIDGNLRRDQEGRVGYEQYAAKAMMLFGYDMYRAYDAESHLMVQDVQGQPIPVDTRLHRNITPAFTVSEPYLFDGLEFGFDARSHRFATSIYAAQEARYHDTGILTAVSESHIDVAPYFIYSSVWGGGAPWAVMTFSGDRMDSRRTVTTKVAFAWDALFGTDYTRELLAAIAPLGDVERGWPEGIYEVDGTTNTSVTVNTNAVVLAALAFRAYGPLIRTGQ